MSQRERFPASWELCGVATKSINHLEFESASEWGPLPLQGEIREEELAICQMRGITPRRQGNPYGLGYLLTQHQLQRLYRFTELYSQTGVPMSRNIVYNLQDDPDYTLGWSLTHYNIPPYRRNSSGFFVPAIGRYMTVRERLASLGPHALISCPTFPNQPHTTISSPSFSSAASLGCHCSSSLFGCALSYLPRLLSSWSNP